MKIEGRFSIDVKTKKIKFLFDGNKKVNPDKLVNFLRQRCDIEVEEQDIITSKQFKYIMALCNDFAKNFGEDRGYYKWYLKTLYCEENEVQYFSCSHTTKENARGLIDFMIKTGIQYGMNFTIPPYKNGINIPQYVYACFENRVCVKCGATENLHLHHHETVASNGGRIYNDDNLLKMPLCGECHSFVHNLGLEEFTRVYHIEGIHYSSEKWYGKKVWKRLRRSQRWEKILEDVNGDVILDNIE